MAIIFFLHWKEISLLDMLKELATQLSIHFYVNETCALIFNNCSACYLNEIEFNELWETILLETVETQRAMLLTKCGILNIFWLSDRNALIAR